MSRPVPHPEQRGERIVNHASHVCKSSVESVCVEQNKSFACSCTAGVIPPRMTRVDSASSGEGGLDCLTILALWFGW